MEAVLVLRRQTNINNGEDEWYRVIGGDCLVKEGGRGLFVVLLLLAISRMLFPCLGGKVGVQVVRHGRAE
jgi:hypothetical protein